MKKTVLILMFLMASMLFKVTATNATKNIISVTYTFDKNEVLGWLNGTGELKNLRMEDIPSQPLVPYRVANILLPPYTNISDISVQATLGDTHIATIDIQSGQPACIIGEEPTVVEKNIAVYSSDDPYPGTLYRVGTIDSFRGYNILHVQLYPAQYELASKMATYYTEITVQVTLSTTQTIGTGFRGLAEDQNTVENMIDNPSTVSAYDTVPTPLATGTTYEYIIITKAWLAKTFQPLADWKAHWVNGAKVVVVNDTATPEQIKNVIKDYYTNHGTSYVLLGGDAGEYASNETEIIPTHMKYCNASGNWWYMDEDFWYANLFADDNISYYQVYVGRAPVANAIDATHFVNKVIAYEQTDKPKANLFHQSRVNDAYYIPNNPDSRQLAWQCEEYVPKDYTNYELFEENGRIEKTNWTNFWDNKGIMCEHIGHGNGPSYVINYEVPYPPYTNPSHYPCRVTWYDTDCSSMVNSFLPIHTSVACFTGVLFLRNCLAYAYVKADNGAIACFMNDGYGWYNINDATMFSGDFIEMQFKALYQQGYQNIGAILAQSKHNLIGVVKTNDPTFTWDFCYREINLIGDPETPALTKRLLVNLNISASDGGTTELAPGDYTFAKGTNITVTAIPNSNHVFNHWALYNTTCNTTAIVNPIKLTLNTNTTLEAVFTYVADINSDGKVDRYDAAAFSKAFGSAQGDARYNYLCDFNCDDRVDRYDAGIFAKCYGKILT